jgi:hypothetical protein
MFEKTLDRVFEGFGRVSAGLVKFQLVNVFYEIVQINRADR